MGFHANQFTDLDEPGGEMSPEEILARRAFKAAGYEAVEDWKSWVPATDFYLTYTRAWAARPIPPVGEPDASRLDRRQVGILVPLIFPLAMNVTRRVAGVNTRGWAMIGGPSALRTGGEKIPKSV